MKKSTLILGGVCTLILLTVTVTVCLVRSTLPPTSGEFALAGLQRPVRVEIDAHGVPRILAENIADCLQAQGWLMARDRLFQMDLIRRRTFGRLAEILGEALVPSDRSRRLYGFADVAEKAVARMPATYRSRLEAFARGVNALIAAGPLPPEMRALGYRPEAWRPEDSVAVALSMYDPPDLKFEDLVTALSKRFPAPIVELITADHGFLDAPILGPPMARLRIPPRATFDLATYETPTDPSPGIAFDAKPKPGSNGWAVAASRSQSGAPILAGDPHLTLTVPNIWYRFRLETPELAVTGVSIPGIPGVIIGTNGKVAWTFTNPSADLADRVLLDLAEGGYRSGSAVRPFRARRETIAVKGSEAITMDVRETEWGPVLEDTPGTVAAAEFSATSPTALQWVALDPDVLSRMDLLDLNASEDLSEALSALEGWAGPAHNVILADRSRIGWALVGRIPNRVGFSGDRSAPRNEAARWNGYHDVRTLPRALDPQSGWVVNANQRPFPERGFRYGRNWPNDGRAYRLQELLRAGDAWDVERTKALQLDLYSHVHAYYRDILRSLPPGGDPWLTEMVKLATAWDARVTADSAAYPAVKAFRLELLRAFFGPFAGTLPDSLRPIAERELDRDAVVRLILAERPAHWLPRPWKDFDELVRGAAIAAAKQLVPAPDALARLRWGEINRARVRHPFSPILPGWIASWMDMPAVPMPGDVFTPRAATPVHSASMRFIVDLGDPKASVFAQPGGQSGHFLSAHYSDQFRTWADGEYTSFEPGDAVGVIALLPKDGKKEKS